MKDNKKMLITAIAIWGILIILLICREYTMRVGKYYATNQEQTVTQIQATSEKKAKTQSHATIRDQAEIQPKDTMQNFPEEQTYYLSNIEKKDNLVTLEYLEGLSWAEIRDNADELFGEYVFLYEEGDDAFLRDLVDYMENRKGWKNTMSRGGYVYIRHTNLDTFSKKIQAIIDAYNEEKYHKVVCYIKRYTDDTEKLHYEIYSYDYPVTHIGQVAKIKWGPSFYESSEEFGSGQRDSTIYIDSEGFAQHPYIPEGDLVLVNGVSYLSDNGRIISSKYYTYNEIMEQNLLIPIDMSKNYMLHICTEERDLGWVLPATLDVKLE